MAKARFVYLVEMRAPVRPTSIGRLQPMQAWAQTGARPKTLEQKRFVLEIHTRRAAFVDVNSVRPPKTSLAGVADFDSADENHVDKVSFRGSRVTAGRNQNLELSVLREQRGAKFEIEPVLAP